MRFGETLVAEREPLRDTEAVLLVDDRKTEVRHRNAFLKQRMRTHCKRCRPACQRVLRLATRLRRQRSGEPCDLDVEAAEPAAQLPKVLLGEQLRGRHERNLLAAFDSLERGE